MRFYLFVAIVFLVLVVGLVPAAAPYRVCNVKPAQQTDYKTFQVADHVRHRQIVQIATVAQINPAYTSAYSPDGYDSASQSEILAELRRLSLALAQANARAAAQQPVVLPGQPAVTVPVPGQPPATTLRPKGEGSGSVGLAVLNAKCAICHQAGKLASDQRFVLLDLKGNLAPITDKLKNKVITKTYGGSMPPPNNIHGIPPVTDSEFAAIIDLIQ